MKQNRGTNGGHGLTRNGRARQARRASGKKDRRKGAGGTITVQLSRDPEVRHSFSLAAAPASRLARRTSVEVERSSARQNGVGPTVITIIDGKRCPLSVRCLGELTRVERTALGLNRKEFRAPAG